MEPWRTRENAAEFAPSGYVPTESWRRYLAGAARHFRRGIAKAKPDVRCAGMFDREIEAQAGRMKADALRQKQAHLAELCRQEEIMQGRRIQIEQWLQDLRQDLRELETELEVLR